MSKPLGGAEGVLTPLIKQLAEAAMEGEIQAHLDYEQSLSRRNGRTKKTLKTSSGAIELETPRDRSGTFEPQLVRKNQTRLGNSYRDIAGHLQDLYGIEMSTGSISAITDKVTPLVKRWQQRPLEAVYPFVWLDVIHYKILYEGCYTSRAVYTVLALDMEDKKDVLGLYVASKDKKAFTAELKPVYRAVIIDQAEDALGRLEERWGKNTPSSSS